MIIKINDKEYTIAFNFGFIRYVMDQKGFKNFSEYDAFVKGLAFTPETFSPSHYDAYAELVLLNIKYTSGVAVRIKPETITERLWIDLTLFQNIVELFVASQPKQESVNPETRGN